MDYAESIDILSKWAEYGKGLPSRKPIPRWGDISEFIKAGIKLQEISFNNARSDAEIIDSMFQLVGVQEPFLMDLSKNPSFFGAREEKYSDYLKWIIEQVSDNTEWLFELFKISIDDHNYLELKGKKPDIKREVPVEEGHEGQSGRIDILIRYEHALIDIEVKVVDAENADLEKNDGYRKSLEAKYSKEKYTHFHRLLVTDAKKDYYNDESEDQSEWYHVVTWPEVCCSLRQLVLSGVLVDKLLLSALMVSFAGTVEQALLGYRSLESQDNRKYIDDNTRNYINKSQLQN